MKKKKKSYLSIYLIGIPSRKHFEKPSCRKLLHNPLSFQLYLHNILQSRYSLLRIYTISRVLIVYIV